MAAQREAHGDRPVLVQREGRLVALVPGREPIDLPQELFLPPVVWHMAGQFDRIDPEARRALVSQLQPLRRGGGTRRDVEQMVARVAAWAEEYPTAAAAVGVTLQQVGADIEVGTRQAAGSGALELAMLIILLVILIAILWWIFGEKARDLIEYLRDMIEELEDILGGLT